MALAETLVRVTLDTPAGSIEVSVPYEDPIEDFLAELVDTVSGAAASTGAWLLATPRGKSLAPETALAEHGIRDGDRLILRKPTEPEIAAPPCCVRARTRLALPAPLTRTARARIALNTAFAAPREPMAAAAAVAGADPQALSLPVRTSALQSVRTAWAASDYRHRLDQRIIAPRPTRCVTVAVLSPKGGPGKTTVTALLGFLAGDRGFTRDAYTLDLRQFTPGERARRHPTALAGPGRSAPGRPAPPPGKRRCGNERDPRGRGR